MGHYLIKHSALAVVIFALSVAGTANAVIPVTDAVSISTQVRHQAETLLRWKQQFEQMKRQMDAITGSRGIGQLLDNPTIRNALPADWETVIRNVKTTAAYATERQKYPTFPDMPKINEMYDVIASQNVSMSDLYSKSIARLKQIEALMGKIDGAHDPAAKQDLANRLINEQNAIQANQNLVMILQAKQKQDLEAASNQAARELSCKEFELTNC